MKKPKRKKHKKGRRPFGPPLSKKRKKKRVWLNVLPDDLWMKVGRGKTIWEALLKEDFELEGECGGYGKCGKCRIKVISSIGPSSEEERSCSLIKS